MRQSGLAGLDSFDSVDDSYGVDEQGLGGDDDFEGIEVPECNFALTDNHFMQLQQAVDPLQESNNYGIDLYQSAIEFISRTVQQNQSVYNV